MMRFDEDMLALAAAILSEARRKGLKIATAESCTGGMVSALLTAIPGSSDVFERGFVTYSNEAKSTMIGVPALILARHGAVSGETAVAMAEGALSRSLADCAVAVTGVAGPGGGSPDKPVGLVHFCGARRGCAPIHTRHVFPDKGRNAIREAATRAALKLCQQLL